MVGPDELQFHKLITRGNLDGIACAAVFLERYPDAEVVFVTSPPAAVEEARSSDEFVLITDVPLNAEMAGLLSARQGKVRLVDHHPTALRSDHAYVVRDRSAAGALHDFLGNGAGASKAASLADLHECSGSPLTSSMLEQFGRERVEREATSLDLSWRFNVEDYAFRADAARAMSKGLWPSEVPAILERSRAVQKSERWNKAVSLIADNILVRGKVGLLDLRGKRCSLHGFGSVALTEVARSRGCGYTVLLHDSRGSVTASLRSTEQGSMDLGGFVEQFTKIHGVDGGGHPMSAGARIPRSKADLLIDQLVTAAC